MTWTVEWSSPAQGLGSASSCQQEAKEFFRGVFPCCHRVLLNNFLDVFSSSLVRAFAKGECACSLATGQLRVLALLAFISCIMCSENGYRYPRDSPIFSRAAVESGQQFGRLASAQQPSLPTTSSEAGSGRPSATGATTTFSWPAALSYPVQAQELPGQDADTRVQTAMLCPSGPTGL